MSDKKQYGFFCYDAEQWGIVIYNDAVRAQVKDEGPFKTFCDAKRALIQTLKREADDLKEGIRKARKITKKDFHL